MKPLASALAQVERMLSAAVSREFAGAGLRALSDDDLLGMLSTVSRIDRLADALLVEAAGEVAARSASPVVTERLSARRGCRSVNELLQRATRLSHQTVAEHERVARGVARPMAPSSGELLAADYPALRAALADGEVGAIALDGVLRAMATTATLGSAERLAVDAELAASARGAGADGGPSAAADDLRLQAQVWATYLDQDGAEPREARAMRKRGVTLGTSRDGVVPLRGTLLPETAAQLQTIFDSILNPKLDGPRFAEDGSDEWMDRIADTRTRPQRQHDALMTALTVAAASGELPTIGGAAPTLVVSVRAEDLASGRGYAHVEGCDEAAPVSTARHAACAGRVERVVIGRGGSIRSLSTSARAFNRRQRRAISLRDGGCVIPGCRVPASWCELHHVDEHANGGPTHTDNGVMLCWFHHRTLDTSGWQIRMADGVPEVRGPSWWDAEQRWRPVTRSPTRLRERIPRRT